MVAVITDRAMATDDPACSFTAVRNRVVELAQRTEVMLIRPSDQAHPPPSAVFGVFKVAFPVIMTVARMTTYC